MAYKELKLVAGIDCIEEFHVTIFVKYITSSYCMDAVPVL
jgi:hypothetical protein